MGNFPQDVIDANDRANKCHAERRSAYEQAIQQFWDNNPEYTQACAVANEALTSAIDKLNQEYEITLRVNLVNGQGKKAYAHEEVRVKFFDLTNRENVLVESITYSETGDLFFVAISDLDVYRQVIP